MIFCQGGGGGGSKSDCQKTDLTTFVVLFFVLVLNLLFYSFTVVYQWFISKKTIIFQRGPRLSRGGGSTFFQGRNEGV